MQDPFSPDFIDTPIAPEPPSPAPQPTSAQPAPSFPHRPARSMAVAMLAAGLVAGRVGGGAIGAALASQHKTAATTTASTVGAGVAAPAPAPGSFAAIYQQTAPGVVMISTAIARGGARSFSQAEGSGIVVDKQGDILTNAHVVSGATQVQVTFSDGHTAAAQVKGIDQSADLAVVKVSVSQDQLHPLAVGNSDTLQVGDPALAIGAPFGLAGSFTAGIISGLNRSTTAPNNRALTGMIQTDAPINPGNSGGALLDGQGQLIGINDSIQSPVEGNVGVGFAIPINRAETMLQSLEKGIAIEHPWLGISGQTLTATTASQLGLSEKSGVLIVAVVPNGPSAKAGLQADGQPSANDDVITAIDAHAITTIDQLTQYLDTKKVGDRGSRHGDFGGERHRLAGACRTDERELQSRRYFERGRHTGGRHGENGPGSRAPGLDHAAGRPEPGAGVPRLGASQSQGNANSADLGAGGPVAASGIGRPAELQRHGGLRERHQPGRRHDRRQRPGEGQHRLRDRSGLDRLYAGQDPARQRPKQTTYGCDQRPVTDQLVIPAGHFIARQPGGADPGQAERAGLGPGAGCFRPGPGPGGPARPQPDHADRADLRRGDQPEWGSRRVGGGRRIRRYR